MIKDYIVLGESIVLRPFLPLFRKKLNGSIVHVAHIKLDGLSKFVDDLCKNRDYNLLTTVKGFKVLYIRGVPFFLGKKAIITEDCLYHIHQLSLNVEEDEQFFRGKRYIMTLHDYYCICERFFLLDYDFTTCKGKCCKNSLHRYYTGTLTDNALCVTIPDDSMVEILFKYLPYKDYKVIPHGI